MSQLVFDHLLNLSLAWHTRRKTGEVIRILDRGAAINHVFELIIFNVIPTLADIGIALYIFFWYFGPDLSFFIAVIMVSYGELFCLLVTLAHLRSLDKHFPYFPEDKAAQANERCRCGECRHFYHILAHTFKATRGIHTDSLLNYETVKYFGGEEHEGERYREAISRYQSLEIRVMGLCHPLFFARNY